VKIDVPGSFSGLQPNIEPMNDINPFFLIAALFGVTLWHELGHLAAARWLGVPVVNLYIGLGPILWRRTLRQAPDLVLRAFPLGMSVAIPSRRTHDGKARRPYRHDLLIAAAGPIASFVLTLLLFAIARWVPMPYSWAYGLVGVGLLSTAIALLNLLPVPGLDGGHLLMLAAARKGWEMTPTQEARLQRASIQWVVIISLVPLMVSLWTRFVVGAL
jgi:membrane-associated protease RseP (regulator of RpoE activity)